MNFLDTKEIKSSTVIDYDLICKNSSTWCLVVIVLALNGRDSSGSHFEENKMVCLLQRKRCRFSHHGIMSLSSPQITSLHCTLAASVYDDLSPHHCINGSLQLLFQLCELSPLFVPGHTNDIVNDLRLLRTVFKPGRLPRCCYRSHLEVWKQCTIPISFSGSLVSRSGSKHASNPFSIKCANIFIFQMVQSSP